MEEKINKKIFFFGKKWRNLLQLMEKLGGLEIIRNLFVVASDNFVDLLFPAGLGVSPGPDSGEKLAQSDFNDRKEVIRHLKGKIKKLDEDKGLQNRKHS
jgi:hypothetical protein